MTESTTLTVTAGPGFTAKWLAPRMFDFTRAHPGIELRFSASLRALDFEREEIDVAIRYGASPDPGLFSHCIYKDWLTPMMTPGLAKTIRRPEDLRNAPLLHQDPAIFQPLPPGWLDWFRAAGLGAAPTGGPVFSQPDHAVDAAVGGAGVVLGRISLAHGALRDGALVAPFPIALKTAAIYRFVCPEGVEIRPHVKAFLNWIVAQASELADYALTSAESIRPLTDGSRRPARPRRSDGVFPLSGEASVS